MSAAIAGAATSAANPMLATNFFITPPLSFPCVEYAAQTSASLSDHRSEMPDYVSGEQPHVIFVRRDRYRRRIEVAVEGRRVVGLVVGHFRTHLDLRREPMLPAEPNLGVAGCHAGALPLLVVIIFGAQRNVIERRDLVVPVRDRSDYARRAGDHVGIAAVVEVRRVELDDPGSKGIAAGGDDAGGIGYVQHVPLTERVGLERDVKLFRELVVPGHSVPLKIVVSPRAAVDRVRANVHVVPGAVGLIAHAAGD